MRKKIELNKEQVDYLSSLPEHGMGYQIVEITLLNGQILKHRTVLNSTHLLLNDEDEINIQDILSIDLETKNN